MTVKSRLEKLEKTCKPAGRLYVVYDDKDHVIAHPGGYMTKAEFEALALGENDTVLNVVHVDKWKEVRVGVDLEKI